MKRVVERTDRLERPAAPGPLDRAAARHAPSGNGSQRPRRLSAALALAVAACSTQPSSPPSPQSPPSPGTTGAWPAPADVPDGPPPQPPADLATRQDAQPRIEPVRRGGPNKPYTVAGRLYVPIVEDLPFEQTGVASWYGRRFHGRATASGEPFDALAMTAAHPTLPLPSYAAVTNPANGRRIVVRVNDRGPFIEGRVIDLSYAAAVKLGVAGLATVHVRRLTHAEIRAAAPARPARPAFDDL